MSKGSGGISGLAVTMATAGGFFVWIGIRNVPVLTGLRDIMKGKAPTPVPGTPTPTPPELAPDLSKVSFSNADNAGGAAMGGTGSRIADAARKYLGTPYVWGGAQPGGMDCSGLVTYVLAHDLGLTNLPSQAHTVTTQFLVWSGAQTVPRDQCAAGDLVCWTGHIGIAIDRDNMIHAPDIGQVVKTSRIWNVPPPTIRRVKLSANGGFGGADSGSVFK